MRKTGRQTTCRRSLHHELAFANHVHEFDAGQDCLRRAKRFEAEHRPGEAFDSSVALSDFCQKMALILLNNFCFKLLNATEPKK